MALETIAKLLPTFTTEESKLWKNRGICAANALLIAALACATWKLYAMASVAKAAVTLTEAGKIGALYGLVGTTGGATVLSFMFGLGDASYLLGSGNKLYPLENRLQCYAALTVIGALFLGSIGATLSVAKCWYLHGRVYTQI